MNDREKLIELICEACRKTETCNSIIADECRTSYGDCGFCTITADHLIANDVGFLPCKLDGDRCLSGRCIECWNKPLSEV